VSDLSQNHRFFKENAMRFVASLHFLGALMLATTLSGFAQAPAPASPQSAPVETPPGYTQEEWLKIKANQLKQVDDAQKVSKDSPAMPKNPAAAETLCNQPTFNGKTVWRSVWTPRWKSPSGLNLGSDTDFFDMSDNSCIPKSYDLYVPNGKPVKVILWRDLGASCTAVEAYADNPVKDYGSVFTGALPANALGGVRFSLTALPIDMRTTTVEEESNLEAITLPSSGVKDTAATVTISCHADTDDVDVGVQQKFVVHYGGIDLFSGSTGAIVSTLGKKTYGVNTVDTGTKNADGTPVTKSTIGVTSSSNAQLVPIGLVNLNWAGNEKNNLNFQFGVGINPNGSSTKVEYFLSPLAFATHHVYIAPGVHIAQSERVGSGFSVGEVVGSGFTAPTTWQTTYKFGVTISVKPYK
jgi:hypothetical protein